MTTPGASLAESAAPYADNPAFLDDLRRFVESLLATADRAATDSHLPASHQASHTWRAIAARMAATVKAEIFIPLAHVALVFQLDARDVQLLSLALMIEADRSISDAFSTLTRTLNEAEGIDDHARSTSATSKATSLRTATYLLGDIRGCLFADSPLCVHQLIELVDVNVSTLDGAYRLASALTAYLLGLAAPQPRIGDQMAVDVIVEESLAELIVGENIKRPKR